jgi:hypothetical protein
MQVFAIKSGNWSDPTIWSYQAVPGVEDTVYSAGKTVTIDVDIACNLITTDSPFEDQFFGGEFILEDNVTFIGGIAGRTNTCLKFSGTNSTIIGSISGGDGGYLAGVENLGSGTLNILGEVRGGNGGYSYGVNNTSTGTINLSGTSLLGLGGYSWGIWNTGLGKVFINGQEYTGEGGFING